MTLRCLLNLWRFNSLACSYRTLAESVIHELQRHVRDDLESVRLVAPFGLIKDGSEYWMRMDNGSGLVSLVLAQWAEEHCIQIELLSRVNQRRTPLLNGLTERTGQ
jgi:hypothetical protein